MLCPLTQQSERSCVHYISSLSCLSPLGQQSESAGLCLLDQQSESNCVCWVSSLYRTVSAGSADESATWDIHQRFYGCCLRGIASSIRCSTKTTQQNTRIQLAIIIVLVDWSALLANLPPRQLLIINPAV